MIFSTKLSILFAAGSFSSFWIFFGNFLAYLFLVCLAIIIDYYKPFKGSKAASNFSRKIFLIIGVIGVFLLAYRLCYI